jgi:small subunit ribosomal protein S17
MASNAARARASSYSLISESRWSTTTTSRFFATKSGGEGGDEPGDSTPENDTSSSDNIIPPVVDLDSHSNADAYDPFEITKSFGDTSYYYPPSEETDPGYLAQKYEGMTNEELVDSSTIDPVTDPHTSTNHTWDSLMHSPPVRDKNAALPKGTLVGTVVSTKMQKTVNVAVDRYKVHPKYRKRIRYTRKFMAHDENEVASDGDLVLIVPSQKISKKKHFVLREILKAKGQL